MIAIAPFVKAFEELDKTCYSIDYSIEQDKLLFTLKKALNEINPTLIYFHAGYETDEDKISEKAIEIDRIIEKHISEACVYLVTDTRQNVRWFERFNRDSSLLFDKAECKGDLAFYCTDSNMLSQLVSWAESKIEYPGVPRCADD